MTGQSTGVGKSGTQRRLPKSGDRHTQPQNLFPRTVEAGENYLHRITRRMQQEESKRSSASTGRRRQSILLVEDDICNRALIEDIFQFDGIPANLVATASAEEGLALVRDLQPMLILMDLKLPGIDGIQATRLLKGSPVTEHIPIWAVTCLSQRGDIERGLDAGCDGYVTKPLRRSEFVFRLLSLWDGPVSGSSTATEDGGPLGSDYWLS